MHARYRTQPIQAAQRRAPAKPRALPLDLTVALYGLFGIYFVSNIYNSALAAQLGLGKWAMLFLTAALLLSSRKQTSPGTASIGWPVLLLFVVTLSMTVAESITQAGALIVSIALLFVVSWLLAERLSEVESLDAFFGIVANLGRLVILSGAVMWPLGLSLGRSFGRFTAWTDNPNTLGMIMAPGMVVLAAYVIERRKGWYIWSLPFLLVGVFLMQQTGSRAAILWFVMSAGCFAAIRYGTGPGTLFGAMAVVLLIGFWEDLLGLVVELAHRDGTHGTRKDGADLLSGRSEIWPLALQLHGERPILGHGIGASGRLIESFDWMFIDVQAGHFHNSYLTILVETGIVGLVAAVVLIVAALLNGFLKAQAVGHRLPEKWPTVALPFVMVAGGLGHAIFETWLLSAGNANAPLFWTCIWLLLRGGLSRRWTPHDGDGRFSWEQRRFQTPRRML
jgi:O-antigen ligase